MSIIKTLIPEYEIEKSIIWTYIYGRLFVETTIFGRTYVKSKSYRSLRSPSLHQCSNSDDILLASTATDDYHPKLIEPALSKPLPKSIDEASISMTKLALLHQQNEQRPPKSNNDKQEFDTNKISKAINIQVSRQNIKSKSARESLANIQKM